MKKEIKQLFKDLEKNGYTVTDTRGGHKAIRHPQKPGVVHSASTPSDHRGLKNLKAQLRRTFGYNA